MATRDKERAKLIIVEIIRQAGGVLENKTNLFKAFWQAHLEFAKSRPGYLSTWPIARMPNGPGIDNFDLLLGELMAEGVLETDQIQKGEFEAFIFALTGQAPAGEPLSPEAVEAVKKGVAFVEGKTATQISKVSHELSRSWNEAKDGEELNIYLDLIPDEEYQEQKAKMEKMSVVLREHWD